MIFVVSWLSSLLFYTNAVFITVLYWSLLYDGGPHPSYKNLYIHGLQESIYNVISPCRYSVILGLVCCNWSIHFQQTVAFWEGLDLFSYSCGLCDIQCHILGCRRNRSVWWVKWKRRLSIDYFLYLVLLGNAYIYDVLDWSDHPGDAGITIAMAAAILPLLYVGLWLIALIRDWVHCKVFSTTTSLTTDSGYQNNAFDGALWY